MRDKPKVYQDLPLLDQDGLHQIPIRLYLLMLVLLRPYICWIVTLTLPAEQRGVLSYIYPHSFDFVRACLICLPVLLILAALTQRVPYDQKLKRGRAKRFWFGIWRQSRWWLLLVCAVDLYWTFSHLPPYVSVNAPWLLLAPVALILGLCWLIKSRRLPLIFAEWPEDKPA
jgi:hypothetical protein